ncbi:hypothetical protein A2U01_0067607, partial [Trifolium medium]|nr:hypothetical protein [Trifolium medium]
MTAQKNVERMEKELQDSTEVSNCDKNIAEWESLIVELSKQIEEYDAKIRAEKLKRANIKTKINTSTHKTIAREANQ